MARRSIAALASIILALTGLAVSVALAIDHLGPVPAYCAEGGCATVRESAWSHPLGIPTPLIGAGFFAIMLALIAVAPRGAAVRRGLAIAGGLAAIGFIVIQGAVIGAWCELCLVVDGAAIALAGLALARSITPVRRAGAAVIGGLAVAAIAAPIAIAGVRSPDGVPAPVVAATLPDVIAREQVPGVVTIVEFMDFECPHCRRMHGRLAAAIEKGARPVRLVRKMVPLNIHPGALAAALAWCAADAQGKGDAMADALIAAHPSTLTARGCERIAEMLGLDLVAYRATYAAKTTQARVEADLDAAKAAGVKYLPTIYVGSSAFMGAGATEAELIAAIQDA
jgi:protein-disulfide isomerase